MRRPLLAHALLLSLSSLPLGCDSEPTKDEAKSSKDEAKPEAKPDEVEPEAKPDEVEPEAKPEADGPPPGVKVKGNLPVKTEAELAAEAADRDKCVTDCVASRQMEARGIEAIEADCNNQCMAEHPIMQVEVVPDGPL